MEKHKAIGIDLGTTFSALAIVNPAGKPEIVPNAEGERTTASAVYVDAEPLVGSIAIDQAGAYPEKVIRWAKRHIGTDWSQRIGSDDYSAVDVSAMVLAKVKEDAEQVCGPIRKAVITVPAYFDEAPRRATKQAAEQAGIEVLRLINEPTAAALAYANSGQANGKVLIYDFGGGTFDVSLVQISGPDEIEVICSNGSRELGGYDLDQALAKHFDELFHAEHGVHLLEADKSTQHETVQHAEETKKILSRLDKREGINLSWNRMTNEVVSVDRATFEDLIANQVEQTMMLVESVLDESGFSFDDVDDVILVGGSTRIPLVERELAERLGRPPKKSINPDEAVALGAALQAAMILQEQGQSDLPDDIGQKVAGAKLQDITNHSYGTTCIVRALGNDVKIRNDILIPKNSHIPISSTKTYATTHDDQQEVECDVTQGEGEDPEFITVIRKSNLKLPPGRPAGCEIEVRFSYDASQIMSCEFEDVETGRTEEFKLHDFE